MWGRLSTQPFPAMRRSLPSALILATAAVVLVAGCSKVAIDIQVPKETIVQRVERQFPIEKKNGLIALTLSNPTVEFKSAENRIGVSADIQAGMQGMPAGRGHMEFDGALAFQDDAFVFTDVKVNEFELNGLPSDGGDQLKQLMKQALLREIKGMSVYRIHPDDPKESMVAQALRDIRVTDEGLTVTLGPSN